MANELVFKRPCGRCPAIGEIPVSIAEIKKGTDPSKDRSREMKITIGGKVVVAHAFLCDACQDICTRAIENIGRELEKRSSTRDRTSVTVEEPED